jgi:hypothetical protein
VRITDLQVAVGKIIATIIIVVVADLEALVVLAEAVVIAVVDAITTIAILKRDIKKTSFLILSTHR